MKTYFEKRLLDLGGELTGIERSNAPLLDKCDAALTILIAYDAEFRDKLFGSTFRSPEEEIYFFRHQRPVFTSAVIYNLKLYRIELAKPSGTFANIKEYYTNELVRIDAFFTRNAAFIQYLRSGSTDLDHFFFLRNKITYKTAPATSYFIIDRTITTDFDWKLGKMIALERLAEYLNQRIDEITQNHTANETAGEKNALHSLDHLLTARQVLKRLRISRTSLQRLKDAGKLPFIKIEGTLYFNEADVIAYINSKRHTNFDK